MFTKELINSSKEHFKSVSDDINLNFSDVYELINSQKKLLDIYFKFNPLYIGGHSISVNSVVFATTYKNLYSFYSSSELIQLGLDGDVFSSLRFNLEALLIGKYCSLFPNSTVFSKWKNKESIYAKKSIINKVSKLKNSEIEWLWNDLNSSIHFSRSSGQYEIDFNFNYNSNLGFKNILKTLLLCNYHLIWIHLFSPRVRYYLNQLDPNIVNFKEARLEAKKIHSSAYGCLPNGTCKKIVEKFKSKWV